VVDTEAVGQSFPALCGVDLAVGVAEVGGRLVESQAGDLVRVGCVSANAIEAPIE